MKPCYALNNFPFWCHIGAKVLSKPKNLHLKKYFPQRSFFLRRLSCRLNKSRLCRKFSLIGRKRELMAFWIFISNFLNHQLQVDTDTILTCRIFITFYLLQMLVLLELVSRLANRFRLFFKIVK